MTILTPVLFLKRRLLKIAKPPDLQNCGNDNSKSRYYKFYIRTYQKSPIVQHYTYNTIKINNYIHIMYTHIQRRKVHNKHTK